jgi:hypothetical protein
LAYAIISKEHTAAIFRDKVRSVRKWMVTYKVRRRMRPEGLAARAMGRREECCPGQWERALFRASEREAWSGECIPFSSQKEQ